MTLRYALLALALAAAPASAQTYDTYASQADLGGGEPDCILTDSNGDIVLLFDQVTASIQAYVPGAGIIVGADNAALNAATGLTIDRCRDAAFDEESFDSYFILADSDNTDVIVRINGDDAVASALTNPDDATDAAQGSIGLAVSLDNETLYVTRSEFNGAPEDGVYTLDTTTPQQTPAALEVNADYDLNGIAVDNAGDLYVASSEFGAGDFVNVVIKITADGSAAPEVIAMPCDDGLFVNCTDGGIEELVIGLDLETDTQRLFVANNSFAGPDGEVVAVFDLDGSNGEIVFSEAAAVAALGIPGVTTAGNDGYLAYGGGRLFFASRADFDGTAGIFTVTVPSAVAAEGAPEGAFALALAPNPTAGAARVSVTAEAPGALTVDVLDLLGRRVATLFEGSAAPGQTVTATAAGLAPGVYVVRAQGVAGVATQRLTVVR